MLLFFVFITISEVFHAIVFPVALSGQQYGVHRVLPTYKNENLNRLHSRSVMPPTLVWVQVLFIHLIHCVGKDIAVLIKLAFFGV